MEKEPSREIEPRIEELLKEAEDGGFITEIMTGPELKDEISEEALNILTELNNLGWKAPWQR